MNKFRRFLGRISAETYLKMGYVRSKYQKSPSAGNSAPRPLAPGGWKYSPLQIPFKFINQKYVQHPSPILHTRPFWILEFPGWCRCLAILGQKGTETFFSPLSLKCCYATIRPSLRDGNIIETTNLHLWGGWRLYDSSRAGRLRILCANCAICAAH